MLQLSRLLPPYNVQKIQFNKKKGKKKGEKGKNR